MALLQGWIALLGVLFSPHDQFLGNWIAKRQAKQRGRKDGSDHHYSHHSRKDALGNYPLRYSHRSYDQTHLTARHHPNT